MDIIPSGSNVALEFLDSDDDQPNDENDCLYALCVGVGKDVKSCKRGDTVIVDKWAREGLKVSDTVVLCESYCVRAVVKA